MSDTKKLIAVVGATGHQGGAVVRALQASGQFKVRALTRSPAKHPQLADEVVLADLDRPQTLKAAFAGAHGIFLVTNFREPGTDERKQAPAAVHAAKDAGAAHFCRIVGMSRPCRITAMMAIDFSVSGSYTIYWRVLLFRGTHTHELPVRFARILAMQISDVPFGTTEWSVVEKTEHKGETGIAYWRTRMFGAIRVRMVEYTPRYLADHWCSKGHILLCIEGVLHTELKDGRTFTLTPGMSYQVADGAEPHRSFTEVGAKLFIVD